MPRGREQRLARLAVRRSIRLRSPAVRGERAGEAAAELEDLAFEEGIQRLVDEAAAMHLRSTSSWSSESEAVDRADRELESWFSSLASEADRLLEHLEAEFGTREAETIQEGELEAAAEAYFAEHATEHPATEQFLGGLVRKATKLVKGVHNIVKKGVAAVGKLLPLGKLFGASGAS